MEDNSKTNVFIVGLDEGVRKMWFNAGYNVILDNIAIADIVCFVGGWDIDPAMYGEVTNPKAGVRTAYGDDKRDITGWNMAPKDALKVGICRGGQFINIMNGGKLYQHVSGHASKHKIFDTVWNREMVVTSSHHQMMIPSDSGEVFAYAEGVGSNFQRSYGDVEKPEHEPEAVWYEATNSLALQFHPEWVQKDTQEYDYFFDMVDLVRG